MPAARTVAAVVRENIAGKSPELRETVTDLRALIAARAPQSRETVNSWGLLTFEAGGPFASLLFAARHVSLVFGSGTSLPDKTGLLEGTGKNLRHVKLRSPDDVGRPALAALIEAAVALNAREAPDAMGGPAKKGAPGSLPRRARRKVRA